MTNLLGRFLPVSRQVLIQPYSAAWRTFARVVLFIGMISKHAACKLLRNPSGIPFRCLWIVLLLSSAASFFISCGERADPAPKPQAPPPFEFVSAWDNKGTGPGKLDQPSAFATDFQGNVFFVDPAGNFVHKFEAKGTPLLTFEDSRIRHAAGIAVDSGGAIYVVDPERGNIFIFFPDGSFLRNMHMPLQRKFTGTLGISVDESGNLYVPDPAGSKIVKYDARGRLVKSWPAPKDKSPDERPSSVATAEDGSVFVVYGKTGRVEKYSADGTFVASWLAGASANGVASPLTGFAVGREAVFTMVGGSPEIDVWRLDGQPKLTANLGAALGAAPIAAPQIAVTPHSELLVFDPAAPRVYEFRMHLDAKEAK